MLVEQKHDSEICFIQKRNLSHSDNGVIYYGNHENWESMKPSKAVGSTYTSSLLLFMPSVNRTFK